NAGQFPNLTPTTKFAQSDCLWLEAPDPVLGAEGIGHLVKEFLPKRGIDPMQQVQVLCPATRGEIGTRQLNTMLQQILNPPQLGKRVPRRDFSAVHAALHPFKPKSFVYWPDACQATGDSGRTNQSHWGGHQPHHGSTAVYCVGRSSETSRTPRSNSPHVE